MKTMTLLALLSLLNYCLATEIVVVDPAIEIFQSNHGDLVYRLAVKALQDVGVETPPNVSLNGWATITEDRALAIMSYYESGNAHMPEGFIFIISRRGELIKQLDFFYNRVYPKFSPNGDGIILGAISVPRGLSYIEIVEFKEWNQQKKEKIFDKLALGERVEMSIIEPTRILLATKLRDETIISQIKIELPSASPMSVREVIPSEYVKQRKAEYIFWAYGAK